MTKTILRRAYKGRTPVVLTAVCLMTSPAAAQDFSGFERALTDCVNYMKLRPSGMINFLGGAQDPRTDEDGIAGDVLYPAGASGSTWDYAMSYQYEVGNSLTAPTWTCGGVGKVSPTWPQFLAVTRFSADARIRAGGLVELDFPGGPIAYANCTAEVPDVFLTLNPGAGDRVVFAAVTGPAAQAYCSSLGVKG